MEHHEVFAKFCPFSGISPSFCQTDFLGITTRQQFVANLAVHSEPTAIVTDYPTPDEEYFEWIDLLQSVVSAKDFYTMIELGAGFGRWVVRAAHAVKKYRPDLPYQLIAVEAEPTVFEWMHTHFIDNSIDPSQHRLIHAAVSDTPGWEVLFYVGGPRGGPYDRRPDDWYGQSLTKDYDVSSQPEPDGEYQGFKVSRHESGWRSIHVPAISLRGLLRDLEHVDLVDMDIEEKNYLP